MGEAIKPTIIEPNKSTTTAPGEKSTGGHTDTEKTGEGRKRGRPRKQSGPGEENPVLPRMVNVTVPEPDAPKPAPTKKKPVKKTTAAKSVSAENISGVLKASFDIIGNREGYELWKLDPGECDQLAEPLSKLIAKSSYLEKITDQYGEYVALIIAVSIVIMPRVLIQLKQNKEKKKTELEKKREKKNHDQKTGTIRNEGHENRTPGTSDRQPIETITGGVTNVDQQFHKSIPHFPI